MIRSAQGDTAERADDDDGQRRRPPDGQQDKANESDAEIPGVLTELVQSGCRAPREQPDHRRVDAAHHSLRADTLPESLPEGQRAHEDEHAGKKDGDQASAAPANPCGDG